MSIHSLKGFKEIAPKYHVYVFDIWGVIHNGVEIFPGVLETLTMLKQQEKQVCFLSNSPRAGIHHERFFSALGIDRALYDFIYTSGDALFQAIANCPSVSLEDPFFFIGDEMLHQPVLSSMKGEWVPVLAEARYILCTAPMVGSHAILQEALTLGLPLICSNPDRFAIQGNEKIPCAGSVAEAYEKMGGHVFYCGKPEPFIYRSILEKLKNPDLKTVLAIGDGLFTDIKGAQGAGIDSLFIHAGLHNDIPFLELEEWSATNDIAPQYMMNRVRW